MLQYSNQPKECEFTLILSSAYEYKWPPPSSANETRKSKQTLGSIEAIVSTVTHPQRCIEKPPTPWWRITQWLCFYGEGSPWVLEQTKQFCLGRVNGRGSQWWWWGWVELGWVGLGDWGGVAGWLCQVRWGVRLDSPEDCNTSPLIKLSFTFGKPPKGSCFHASPMQHNKQALQLWQYAFKNWLKDAPVVFLFSGYSLYSCTVT